MTVEQSLAGAMGCASWRARSSVLEYRAIAPAGTVIRGGEATQPWTDRPSALGLNEVGVTDAVMATLWRFAPNGAAVAVSSGAEAAHVGADIAFVHASTARVILYQAKLAELSTDLFKLKSSIPTSHVKMLRRRHVKLAGVKYSVTGRVALYQADLTPFIERCRYCEPMRWELEWPWRVLTPQVAPDPTAGRRYYEEAIARCGCSPSGVLAAPLEKRGPITHIAAATTWPWEFDVHEWFRGSSPLDDQTRPARDRSAPTDPPRFEPYAPRSAARPSPEAAQATLRELHTQLRLPSGQRLYVVII